MAEYDVVLSYAAEDVEWAGKLADGLSKEGVRVLSESTEITPSQQLQKWLSENVFQDYKLIIICSPHYFRDDQVGSLLANFSRQYSDQLKIQRPLVPVIPPDSRTLSILNSFTPIDFGNKEDFELRLRQLVEALDITQQKTGLRHHLKALLRWVGLGKPNQEFKDLVAELYLLFGFEVNSDQPFKDVKVDFFAEKQSGGYPFRIMIECAENQPSRHQIDSLIAKYRLAQSRFPSIGCLLVAAQELSADTRTTLENVGIRGTTYLELLKELLPLDIYIEKSIAQFEKWRAEHWNGEDWFIRPDVTKELVGEKQRAWKQIAAWLGDKSVKEGNLLTLLGDVGMGKTTMALFLAYEMAKAYQADPLRHPAPVLIPLINTRKEVSLESIVISHFSQVLGEQGMKEFSFPRFDYLVRRGRIVLLFDAFDEMVDRVDSQVIQSNLNQLRRPADQGGKVFLTCRTHYAKTREEQEKLFGKGTIYLQRFTDEQVQTYMANARPRTKDEDWRTIRMIYNLNQLMPIPMLLDMVVRALLGTQIVNAAKLYAQCADFWFDREQKKGRILDKQIKISLMQELAWRIWHEGKHTIHFQELLRVVKDLKRSKTLDFGAETNDHVAEEMRTATFLRRDDEGNYSFADTSFGEYFLACKIYQCLKRADAPTVILELLRTRLFDQKVIFFLEKMISEDGVNYRPFQQILQSEYDAQVSENALQILYWSERIRCEMEEVINDPETLRQALTGHIPRGACLSNARLKGVVLEAADLSEADFSGADLTEANLNQARLDRAKFRGTTLMKARMEGVSAAQANFREAQLSQALIKGSVLAHSDFTGVIHRQTVFEENDTQGAIGLNVAGTLFRVNAQPVVQQHFSPGSHTLTFDSGSELCASSGYDGLIVIFRIRDERLLHVLEGHRRQAHSLQFSPSGTLLISGGREGNVRLWSVSEGQLLNEHKQHKGNVNAIHFSPDGSLVASGGEDQIVRIWTVDNNQIRFSDQFQGHQSGITAMHFSSDGKMLASGSEHGNVRLWNVNTGYLIQVLRAEDQPTAAINALQFSPDGRLLATGGADRLVRIWSVSQGALLRVLKGHDSELLSLDFSPDGQSLVSGGKDGDVQLWTVSDRISFKLTDNSLMNLAKAEVHRNILDRLAQLINREVSGKDQFLHLLKTRMGIELPPELNALILSQAIIGPLLDSVIGHEDWVSAVRFSSDGKQVVSGSGDRRVRLWSIRDNRLEAEVTSGSPRLKQRVGIRAVRISSDGQLIAAGREDHSVFLWSSRESRLHRVLEGHTDLVRSVDISPDGQFVAGGGEDRTIRIWSLQDGSLLHTTQGHKGNITSVHFSPNKDWFLASGSEDKTIGIWLANTGQLSTMLSGHRGAVNAVQFSPDGALLASASEDKTIRLWAATKGQIPREQRRLEGHTAGVQAVQFSPNGALLASAGKDKSVRLWTVANGRMRQVFNEHTDVVSALRFFPNALRLASASEDGRIRIWNVESGNLEHELFPHLGKVHGIDISRNGKYLIAAGSAGRLQIWEIATQKIVLYRYAFGEGSWLDLLPDGRFHASVEGRNYLCYTERGELNSHSAEVLMTDFSDSDAVQEILEQFAGE